MTREEVREQVKNVAKVEDMLEELFYQIQGTTKESDRLLLIAIDYTHEVWKTLWRELIDMYWADKESQNISDINNEEINVEHDINDINSLYNEIKREKEKAREVYLKKKALGPNVPIVSYSSGYRDGLQLAENMIADLINKEDK